MEGVKKKRERKISLYLVFIRYLFRFCAWMVILAAGLVLLYLLLAGTGAIRAADYEQASIEENAEEIRSSAGGEETLIPDSCSFGVFGPGGEFLRGTFDKEEAGRIWESWEQGDRGRGYNTFYRGIEKENGDLVLIQYQLIPKFENPLLRRLIPNLEFLMLTVFLILFAAGVWLNARHFGRFLKKRLDVLEETADKVTRKDLDFGRGYSDIKEIDQVLASLFLMKEALQSSLKEQWEAQRRKQEQIAALAHDIKTPLTIIRGNAELIQETDQLEEIRSWDLEILERTADMEQYLISLKEALQQSGEASEEAGEFETGSFLNGIREMAEALGRAKKLKIESRFEMPETVIRGRKGIREELERAVLNVISNGADYCPDEGTLVIRAEEERQQESCFLKITVTDSGPGFTEEALLHGTEQFYQADKSRKGTAHYGMGLYITSTLLQKHGGRLELGNSEDAGGMVVIHFPVTA